MAKNRSNGGIEITWRKAGICRRMQKARLAYIKAAETGVPVSDGERKEGNGMAAGSAKSASCGA